MLIIELFRNERLQGAAPLEKTSNIILFGTAYYENVNNNENVKKKKPVRIFAIYNQIT